MSRRESRQNSEPTPPAVTKAGSATVADARTVLKAMQDAEAALETRLAADAEARKAVAASALLDKDDEAARRLSDLNAEARRLAVDLENTRAAISVQKVRLEEALAREQAVCLWTNARRAAVLLEERQRLAVDAQKALDSYARTMSELIGLGRELRRLCDRAPSERHEGLILRASMQNSRCAMFRLGLLSMEPLPPEPLRASLLAMLEHIDAPARRFCEAISGDGGDQKGTAA